VCGDACYVFGIVVGVLAGLVVFIALTAAFCKIALPPADASSPDYLNDSLTGTYNPAAHVGPGPGVLVTPGLAPTQQNTVMAQPTVPGPMEPQQGMQLHSVSWGGQAPPQGMYPGQSASTHTGFQAYA